jgi:hypothetical protein
MNTAQDIVAYLLAATGGGAQDGEHHAIRHAVIHGVREVMDSRDWLWHTKTNSFSTVQPQTTATFSAGGTDMVVASTAQIVPGRLIDINPIYFASNPRVVGINGNIVTVNTPAIQDGTNVTAIPQVYYDLPRDLKDIDTLVTNTVGTLHCYISPQEWQRLEINTRGAGEPYYYTIMRSDTDPTRYQIRFVGVPTNGTLVHYTYRVRPEAVKYLGYERLCRQGTVSLSLVDGVPTVTGDGTDFPQDSPGAYIRFGADGMEAEPAGSNVPFKTERLIVGWDSPTSMTVSLATVASRPGAAISNVYDGGVVSDPGVPPPPTAYTSPSVELPTNTKYAITDVIDASPQMYTAILSACEMWYARIAGKPAETPMALFNRDLRMAMESDVVAPMSGRPNLGQYPTPRSAGWHSNLLPDII